MLHYLMALYLPPKKILDPDQTLEIKQNHHKPRKQKSEIFTARFCLAAEKLKEN